MLYDKRIIIFDLDGTAVDSPAQVLPSPRLKSVVRQLQQTHQLSAATGRPWSYASPVFTNLGLTSPCVISSGTQICDPQTGQILWQSNLEYRAAKQVVEVLKNHPTLPHTAARVLLNDYNVDDHFNGGLAMSNLDITEPTYSVCIVFIPNDIVNDVFERLQNIDSISCTLAVAQAPGFTDIHITAKNATKEHATQRLLAMIGLQTDHAIGVGDGHNDLHLFRAVNHRVAMGNAVDELKQMAHEVLDPVHQDGLAVFFERLLDPTPNNSYPK